ncbi:1-deoxy-D-xylulose-5-phosphate reductoisomerase [Desulfonauticus submarinus]
MDYISSLNIDTSLPRSVVILGSTGSIGQNTLNVISHHPEKFKVIGLACATNIQLLASQINKFRPKYVAVLNKDVGTKLKSLCSTYIPKILWGTQGYQKIASLSEANVIVSAMVGAAGLLPTIAAAQKSKIILLANKESLVLAGQLLRSILKQTNGVILPIDSEHNAIFQVIHGKFQHIKKIILTASGGPFLGKTKKELKNITPEQALNHPNWSMGAKISVDSATLMNKGLEIIEAHYLFGLPLEKIEVIVHPQSIVHSLVKFIDGSHLAQLGIANMQIPISYCLAYPERINLSYLPKLDLTEIANLTFQKPDETNFPCLQIAKQALKLGQAACIALNAANELAVEMFLNKKIGFLDIPKILKTVLDSSPDMTIDSVETILELDKKIRKITLNLVEKIK